MFNRLNLYSVVLVSMLIVIVSACSSAARRSNDAVSLSQDIPPEPTAAPQVTPLPVEPTAQAQPDEPAPPTATAQIPGDDSQSQVNDGPVLVFSLFGGIVGFCDELTVSKNGDYTLRICDQDEIVGTLAEGDLASLQMWHDNLASFNRTFEDNPGGPDNLVTNFAFNGQGQVETDERQQQVIVDWVSSLAIRLRPQQQAEEVPTPEPVAVGPEGLCPQIPRPALITINFEENPSTLVLIDPASQATCDIVLSQPPTGRIATAASNIFYPIFDLEAKATIVWRLDSNGQENPLPFTSIPMEEPGPFDFVVSDDGSKIAWAQTVVDFEVDPPIYRNNLWLANIDGANRIAIVDQAENTELRFVLPIRFSANGDVLYYSLQPDIGGPVFSGRFDNVYSASAINGQAQLLYACSEENPVCVGGLSPNGDTLTVVQPTEGSIQILNSNGSVVNTLPLPATDYIERTAFGPNGSLAFISATLSQSSEDAPPLPSPGYISFIAPPYTGEAQILLSNNNVGTLRGWLDENRLVFGSIDQEGNSGTSMVTIDGQVTVLLPNVAVGVMR